MSIEESIQQIETLIEAWQLDEADLNQTDINAMQVLLKENQELKQKYENAVADYETTMAEKEQLNSLVNSCQEEIRELKKQLENKYSRTGTLTNEVLYEENTKLINQQKEFINYLEDEFTKIQNDIEKEIDNNVKYFKVERRQIITEILQKYKEIIGGKE